MMESNFNRPDEQGPCQCPECQCGVIANSITDVRVIGKKPAGGNVVISAGLGDPQGDVGINGKKIYLDGNVYINNWHWAWLFIPNFALAILGIVLAVLL